MRLGARQRRRRRVDAQHLLGAAGQRGDREAAGVAVAVEHALQAEVAHGLGEAPAVVALVEVEAGLVAVRDVDRELPVVLADRHLGRAVAAQPAGLRRPAPRGRARWRRSARRAARSPLPRHSASAITGLPALGAGRQELRDQRVGVAVDDQPGQAVGLAVHQAHAVAGHGQPRAQRQRTRDAPLEERRVDALGLVEAPGAQADRRARAVRGPGEKAAVGRLARAPSRRGRRGRSRCCPRTPTGGGAAASAPCLRAGGRLSSRAFDRPLRCHLHLRFARGCAAS